MLNLNEHADGEFTVSLGDNFTFANHLEFRNILKQALPKATRLQFDLGQIKYIDSSGLGMLMLAKYEACARQCELELINVSSDAMRIFKLVHFEDQFTIR